MNQIKHRHPSLRFVAALTTVFFCFNSLAWPYDSEVGGVVGNPPSFTIPAELGSVDEYSPPSPASQTPFVIHIQDAHSSPEAQERIRDLLKYLSSKKPVVVALEGAIGSLRPDYLDFFPKYPKVNEAVVKDLVQESLLSGPELFAWERYQKGKKQRINFVGVETARLYRANLGAYRDFFKNEDALSREVQKFRDSLERTSVKILNSELRKFIREVQRHKEGQFQSGIHSPNLAGYLRFLAQASFSHLGIDLRDRFEQIRFPNLTRLLFLIEFENKLTQRERSLLQSEIHPGKFFEEITLLEKGIQGKLIHKHQERVLVGILNDFKLLEKLSRLELTREEYQEILDRKDDFNLENLKKRLGVIASEQSEQSNPVTTSSAYQIALRFYRLAEHRDQALLENALREAREKSLLVFVTGGFHTSGVTSLLKEKKIPYAVVTPRLSKTDLNQTRYDELMMGKWYLKAAAFTVDKNFYPQLDNPRNQERFFSYARSKARIKIRAEVRSTRPAASLSIGPEQPKGVERAEVRAGMPAGLLQHFRSESIVQSHQHVPLLGPSAKRIEISKNVLYAKRIHKLRLALALLKQLGRSHDDLALLMRVHELETATEIVGLVMQTHLFFHDARTKSDRVFHVDPHKNAIYFSLRFLDSIDATKLAGIEELAVYLDRAQRLLTAYRNIIRATSDLTQIHKQMRKEEKDFESKDKIILTQDISVLSSHIKALKAEDEKIEESKLRPQIKSLQKQIWELEKELVDRRSSDNPPVKEDYFQLAELFGRLAHLQENIGLYEEALQSYRFQVDALHDLQRMDSGQLPIDKQEAIVLLLLLAGLHEEFLKELRAFLTGEGLPHKIKEKEKEAEPIEQRHRANLIFFGKDSLKSRYLYALRKQAEVVSLRDQKKILRVEQQVERIFQEAEAKNFGPSGPRRSEVRSTRPAASLRTSALSDSRSPSTSARDGERSRIRAEVRAVPEEEPGEDLLSGFNPEKFFQEGYWIEFEEKNDPDFILVRVRHKDPGHFRESSSKGSFRIYPAGEGGELRLRYIYPSLPRQEGFGRTFIALSLLMRYGHEQTGRKFRIKETTLSVKESFQLLKEFHISVSGSYFDERNRPRYGLEGTIPLVEKEKLEAWKIANQTNRRAEVRSTRPAASLSIGPEQPKGVERAEVRNYKYWIWPSVLRIIKPDKLWGDAAKKFFRASLMAGTVGGWIWTRTILNSLGGNKAIFVKSRSSVRRILPSPLARLAISRSEVRGTTRSASWPKERRKPKTAIGTSSSIRNFMVGRGVTSRREYTLDSLRTEPQSGARHGYDQGLSQDSNLFQRSLRVSSHLRGAQGPHKSESAYSESTASRAGFEDSRRYISQSNHPSDSTSSLGRKRNTTLTSGQATPSLRAEVRSTRPAASLRTSALSVSRRAEVRSNEVTLENWTPRDSFSRKVKGEDVSFTRFPKKVGIRIPISFFEKEGVRIFLGDSRESGTKDLKALEMAVDEKGMMKLKALRENVVSGQETEVAEGGLSKGGVAGAGRAPRKDRFQASLEIEDERKSISRNHVQISYDELGVIITDLDSKNGTFISLPQLSRLGKNTGALLAAMEPEIEFEDWHLGDPVQGGRGDRTWTRLVLLPYNKGLRVPVESIKERLRVYIGDPAALRFVEINPENLEITFREVLDNGTVKMVGGTERQHLTQDGLMLIGTNPDPVALPSFKKITQTFVTPGVGGDSKEVEENHVTVEYDPVYREFIVRNRSQNGKVYMQVRAIDVMRSSRAELRTNSEPARNLLKEFKRIYEELRDTENLEELFIQEGKLVHHPLSRLTSVQPTGLPLHSVIYRIDFVEEDPRQQKFPSLWKYEGVTEEGKVKLIPLNHSPAIREMFSREEFPQALVPPSEFARRAKDGTFWLFSRRQPYLLEKEAHELIVKMSQLLGKRELQPREPIILGNHSFEIESNKAFDNDNSSEVFLVRVGPLIFIVIPERYSLNHQSFTRRREELEARLGELHSAHADHIFFVTPSNFIYSKERAKMPLSVYSHLQAAAMLAHAERFKDALVAAFGAGNGFDAKVALGLGARHAVLIEKEDYLIQQAQNLLQGNEGGFTPWGEDLRDKEKLTGLWNQLISERGFKNRPKVALVNIGPWTDLYEDANEKALEMAIEWGFDTVINTGYSVDEPGHLKAFEKTEQKFLESGYEAEVFSYHRWGRVLIATRPSRSEARGVEKVENFYFDDWKAMPRRKKLQEQMKKSAVYADDAYGAVSRYIRLPWGGWGISPLFSNALFPIVDRRAEGGDYEAELEQQDYLYQNILGRRRILEKGKLLEKGPMRVLDIGAGRGHALLGLAFALAMEENPVLVSSFKNVRDSYTKQWTPEDPFIKEMVQALKPRYEFYGVNLYDFGFIPASEPEKKRLGEVFYGLAFHSFGNALFTALKEAGVLKKFEASVEDLPREWTQKFHFVVSVQTLRYVLDRLRALEEFYRVLAPGGEMKVSTSSTLYGFGDYSIEELFKDAREKGYPFQYDSQTGVIHLEKPRDAFPFLMFGYDLSDSKNYVPYLPEPAPVFGTDLFVRVPENSRAEVRSADFDHLKTWWQDQPKTKRRGALDKRLWHALEELRQGDAHPESIRLRLYPGPMEDQRIAFFIRKDEGGEDQTLTSITATLSGIFIYSGGPPSLEGFDWIWMEAHLSSSQIDTLLQGPRPLERIQSLQAVFKELQAWLGVDPGEKKLFRKLLGASFRIGKKPKGALQAFGKLIDYLQSEAFNLDPSPLATGQKSRLLTAIDRLSGGGEAGYQGFLEFLKIIQDRFKLAPSTLPASAKVRVLTAAYATLLRGRKKGLRGFEGVVTLIEGRFNLDFKDKDLGLSAKLRGMHVAYRVTGKGKKGLKGFEKEIRRTLSRFDESAWQDLDVNQRLELLWRTFRRWYRKTLIRAEVRAGAHSLISEKRFRQTGLSNHRIQEPTGVFRITDVDRDESARTSRHPFPLLMRTHLTLENKSVLSKDSNEIALGQPKTTQEAEWRNAGGRSVPGRPVRSSRANAENDAILQGITPNSNLAGPIRVPDGEKGRVRFGDRGFRGSFGDILPSSDAPQRLSLPEPPNQVQGNDRYSGLPQGGRNTVRRLGNFASSFSATSNLSSPYKPVKNLRRAESATPKAPQNLDKVPTEPDEGGRSRAEVRANHSPEKEAKNNLIHFARGQWGKRPSEDMEKLLVEIWPRSVLGDPAPEKTNRILFEAGWPVAAREQGQRSEQQDDYLIANPRGQLLAVMDGHGRSGDEASRYVKSRLVPLFEKFMPSEKGDMTQALEQVFQTLHEEMLSQPFGRHSGTTLSLLYIPEGADTAYAANVGDSPILITDQDKTIYTSPEHNVRKNSEERKRAHLRGAVFDDKKRPTKLFTHDRSSWIQLTRSLGEGIFSNLLDRRPSIKPIPLSGLKGPVTFILASDGIYDQDGEFSSGDAEEITQAVRTEEADAKSLVQKAGNNLARDNVTAIVWRRSEMRVVVRTPKEFDTTIKQWVEKKEGIQQIQIGDFGPIDIDIDKNLQFATFELGPWLRKRIAETGGSIAPHIFKKLALEIKLIQVPDPVNSHSFINRLLLSLAEPNRAEGFDSTRSETRLTQPEVLSGVPKGPSRRAEMRTDEREGPGVMDRIHSSLPPDQLLDLREAQAIIVDPVTGIAKAQGTDRWTYHVTPLEILNEKFTTVLGKDLFGFISDRARQKAQKGKKFYVLDWGAGDFTTLRQLDQKNTEFYGFSRTVYRNQFETVRKHPNIHAILDDAENLYGYFKENGKLGKIRLDLIFAHQSLGHYLSWWRYADNHYQIYREHIHRLAGLLAEGGVIIHDLDLNSLAAFEEIRDELEKDFDIKIESFDGKTIADWQERKEVFSGGAVSLTLKSARAEGFDSTRSETRLTQPEVLSKVPQGPSRRAEVRAGSGRPLKYPDARSVRRGLRERRRKGWKNNPGELTYGIHPDRPLYYSARKFGVLPSSDRIKVRHEIILEILEQASLSSLTPMQVARILKKRMPVYRRTPLKKIFKHVKTARNLNPDLASHTAWKKPVSISVSERLEEKAPELEGLNFGQIAEVIDASPAIVSAYFKDHPKEIKKYKIKKYAVRIRPQKLAYFYDKDFTRAFFKALYTGLDEKEKTVLKERTLSKQPKSLEALGGQLFVEHQMISQIEKGALAKVKEYYRYRYQRTLNHQKLNREPVQRLAYFSVRVRRAFETLGIKTVAELIQTNKDGFLKLKNFGPTSLGELKEVLSFYKLKGRINRSESRSTPSGRSGLDPERSRRAEVRTKPQRMWRPSGSSKISFPFKRFGETESRRTFRRGITNAGVAGWTLTTAIPFVWEAGYRRASVKSLSRERRSRRVLRAIWYTAPFFIPLGTWATSWFWLRRKWTMSISRSSSTRNRNLGLAKRDKFFFFDAQEQVMKGGLDRLAIQRRETPEDIVDRHTGFQVLQNNGNGNTSALKDRPSTLDPRVKGDVTFPSVFMLHGKKKPNIRPSPSQERGLRLRVDFPTLSRAEAVRLGPDGSRSVRDPEQSRIRAEVRVAPEPAEELVVGYEEMEKIFRAQGAEAFFGRAMEALQKYPLHDYDPQTAAGVEGPVIRWKDRQGKPGVLVEIRNAQRILVLGDRHSAYENMEKILREVKIEEALRQNPDTHLIFLGDSVHVRTIEKFSDTGLTAKSFDDFLLTLRLKQKFPLQVHTLPGNHEYGHLPENLGGFPTKLGPGGINLAEVMELLLFKGDHPRFSEGALEGFKKFVEASPLALLIRSPGNKFKIFAAHTGHTTTIQGLTPKNYRPLIDLFDGRSSEGKSAEEMDQSPFHQLLWERPEGEDAARGIRRFRKEAGADLLVGGHTAIREGLEEQRPAIKLELVPGTSDVHVGWVGSGARLLILDDTENPVYLDLDLGRLTSGSVELKNLKDPSGSPALKLARSEVRKQLLKDFVAVSSKNHDAAHQHGIFNRFQQIAYGPSNVSGNGRMDLDQNDSRRGGGEEIQKIAVSSNQNYLLSVGHPEDFVVSRARRDTGNLVPRRTEKPLGMARHIFVKKESQLFGEGDKVAVFQLLGHEMEGGSDMLPGQLGVIVGRGDFFDRNTRLKKFQGQVYHDPRRFSVNPEARLPVTNGGDDRYIFVNQAIHNPKINIGPYLRQAKPPTFRAEVRTKDEEVIARLSKMPDDPRVGIQIRPDSPVVILPPSLFESRRLASLALNQTAGGEVDFAKAAEWLKERLKMGLLWLITLSGAGAAFHYFPSVADDEDVKKRSPQMADLIGKALEWLLEALQRGGSLSQKEIALKELLIREPETLLKEIDKIIGVKERIYLPMPMKQPKDPDTGRPLSGREAVENFRILLGHEYFQLSMVKHPELTSWETAASEITIKFKDNVSFQPFYQYLEKRYSKLSGNEILTHLYFSPYFLKKPGLDPEEGALQLRSALLNKVFEELDPLKRKANQEIEKDLDAIVKLGLNEEFGFTVDDVLQWRLSENQDPAYNLKVLQDLAGRLDLDQIPAPRLTQRLDGDPELKGFMDDLTRFVQDYDRSPAGESNSRLERILGKLQRTDAFYEWQQTGVPDRPTHGKIWDLLRKNLTRRSEVRKSKRVRIHAGYEKESYRVFNVLNSVSHPSLPKIKTVKKRYVEMEWIPGKNMKKWAYTSTFPDREFARRVVFYNLQLLDALLTITRRGIGHPDLSYTRNVIIDEISDPDNPKAVLIDWEMNQRTPPVVFYNFFEDEANDDLSLEQADLTIWGGDRDIRDLIWETLEDRVIADIIRPLWREKDHPLHEYLKREGGGSLEDVWDVVPRQIIFPQGIALDFDKEVRRRFGKKLWEMIRVDHGLRYDFFGHLRRYYNQRWERKGKKPRAEVRAEERSREAEKPRGRKGEKPRKGNVKSDYAFDAVGQANPGRQVSPPRLKIQASHYKLSTTHLQLPSSNSLSLPIYDKNEQISDPHKDTAEQNPWQVERRVKNKSSQGDRKHTKKGFPRVFPLPLSKNHGLESSRIDYKSQEFFSLNENYSEPGEIPSTWQEKKYWTGDGMREIEKNRKWIDAIGQNPRLQWRLNGSGFLPSPLTLVLPSAVVPLLTVTDLRAIQAGILLGNGRGRSNQETVSPLRARLGLPALDSKEKVAFIYLQGAVEMGLLAAAPETLKTYDALGGVVAPRDYQSFIDQVKRKLAPGQILVQRSELRAVLNQIESFRPARVFILSGQTDPLLSASLLRELSGRYHVPFELKRVTQADLKWLEGRDPALAEEIRLLADQVQAIRVAA